MTQLDLLMKHVMGGGQKSVNAIGASGVVNSDNDNFKVLYNKEVQFVVNQMGSSWPSFLRQAINQGWTNDHDGNWSD